MKLINNIYKFMPEMFMLIIGIELFSQRFLTALIYSIIYTGLVIERAITNKEN